MIRVFKMGEGARVAAFPDLGGIHLVMTSGASKLAMQLATPTARALATELREQLPPGEPTTRRPAAPRYREQEPTNYAAIVHRMREGRALPRDAEAVAHLLSYLGVKTT